MKKAFVYGMSVEGDNFTDRVNETKRLKMDFENGINVILDHSHNVDPNLESEGFKLVVCRLRTIIRQAFFLGSIGEFPAPQRKNISSAEEKVFLFGAGKIPAY